MLRLLMFTRTSELRSLHSVPTRRSSDLEEMIGILVDVQPDYCTLVPETREELTTEGGLNMSAIYDDFKERVFPAIRKAGIKISLFLDPVEKDIELAAELGADTIELHTGTYANAQDSIERKKELDRLKKAAELVHNHGMIEIGRASGRGRERRGAAG